MLFLNDTVASVVTGSVISVNTECCILNFISPGCTTTRTLSPKDGTLPLYPGVDTKVVCKLIALNTFFKSTAESMLHGFGNVSWGDM